ncbi:MAG: serine/threonine protein kinase [Deltaproteobacteria bacterium]|nr:serine/threonine protein kinase [Deltaproteobacteria bacterium]
MSGLLQPGAVFARRYQIERVLSDKGGMGCVYLARQDATGRSVALKVLREGYALHGKARELFTQEARVGQGIESDHVVQVLDAGVDEATGVPWLAMELLEGEDLAAVVAAHGPLPLDAVRELCEQLFHAVAAGHRRGVVHRDLKPDNVFVGRSRRAGARFTVKVLDFGIAKVLQEGQTSVGTRTVAGTPGWFAPEQSEAGDLGPQTDVWALGLLVFWMLTGKGYWRAGNEESPSLLNYFPEIAAAQYLPASTRAEQLGLGDRLPPGFDAWFSRCVQRNRSARLPNAGAAHDALLPLLTARSSALAPTVLAPPPTLGARRSGPRWRAPAAVAAVLVLGALVLARVGPWSPNPPAPTPPPTATAPGGAGVVTEAPRAPALGAPPTGTSPPSVAPAQDAHVHAAPEPLSVRERVVRGRAGAHSPQPVGEGGEIDSGRVTALVRGQVGGIRACYERALRGQPTLAGRLVVRFTIGVAGRVTAISTSGLESAPEVGACASARIRALVFPAPSGGSVEFSYPFNLSPSQ